MWYKILSLALQIIARHYRQFKSISPFTNLFRVKNTLNTGIFSIFYHMLPKENRRAFFTTTQYGVYSSQNNGQNHPCSFRLLFFPINLQILIYTYNLPAIYHTAAFINQRQRFGGSIFCFYKWSK